MALKGIDYVIKVNTGTDVAPVWTTVAGQRGGTLNGSTSTIDVGSKDGAGWEESLAGLRSWSIDMDGLHAEGDAGLDKVMDAWLAGDTIKVRFELPSGDSYEGSAIVEDLTIDGPHDDVATASGTLKGTGALTKINV